MKPPTVAGKTCQCRNRADDPVCGEPAHWEVDPDSPAFSFYACERHARISKRDGLKVDGPELELDDDGNMWNPEER